MDRIFVIQVEPWLGKFIRIEFNLFRQTAPFKVNENDELGEIFTICTPCENAAEKPKCSKVTEEIHFALSQRLEQPDPVKLVKLLKAKFQDKLFTLLDYRGEQQSMQETVKSFLREYMILFDELKFSSLLKDYNRRNRKRICKN
jgi:hypothetical protein